MNTDTRNQATNPLDHGPAFDPQHPNAAVPPETPETPKRGVRAKVAAGVLAAALVVGGGFAATRLGGSDSSAAASSSQAGPGGAAGVGGAGVGGAGSGAAAPGGAAPVSGTITAVSSTSISVQTAAGDATTYSIADDAVVENDGATATVSDLAVGDDVVVFTGAAPGSTSATTDSDAASRILAGTSATDAPAGGQAPGGQASGGQASGGQASGGQAPAGQAATT